jgi:hypothetical protein
MRRPATDKTRQIEIGHALPLDACTRAFTTCQSLRGRHVAISRRLSPTNHLAGHGICIASFEIVAASNRTGPPSAVAGCEQPACSTGDCIVPAACATSKTNITRLAAASLLDVTPTARHARTHMLGRPLEDVPHFINSRRGPTTCDTARSQIAQPIRAGNSGLCIVSLVPGEPD